MRHLKLLLVLILAAPLHAAAPTRTGLPSLPILPGSALGCASADATLSPTLRLTSSPSAQVHSAAPPAAIAPTPAPAIPASANERLPLPERLASLFRNLDAHYFLPEGTQTAKIRARVRSQLLAAARDYTDPEPELLETVAREADKALVKIQDRINKGRIDPSAKIRVSASDPEAP